MGRSESGGPWAFKSTKTHTAGISASSSFHLLSRFLSPRSGDIPLVLGRHGPLGRRRACVTRSATRELWGKRAILIFCIILACPRSQRAALFGLKIGSGTRPSSPAPFFVVWSRLSPPPERKRAARCGIAREGRRLSRYLRYNFAKSARGCCIKCEGLDIKLSPIIMFYFSYIIIFVMFPVLSHVSLPCKIQSFSISPFMFMYVPDLYVPER